MTQETINFDAVTFSRPLAEKAKEEGMSLAVSTRGQLLTRVRMAVMTLAMSRDSQTATADDGQEWLIEHGYNPADLGNAAGSMFPAELWECVGWTKSTRVSSHARAIRVWRLK